MKTKHQPEQPLDLSIPQRGWKLFRLRKDGAIRSLFIDKNHDLPIGEWMRAEEHPTKGFANRAGWHVCFSPNAPHLKEEGRVWMPVEVDDAVVLPRPDSQGGAWMLAKWVRILPHTCGIKANNA